MERNEASSEIIDLTISEDESSKPADGGKTANKIHSQIVTNGSVKGPSLIFGHPDPYIRADQAALYYQSLPKLSPLKPKDLPPRAPVDSAPPNYDPSYVESKLSNHKKLTGITSSLVMNILISG